MGLTMTELVERYQPIWDHLSELGELSVRYTRRTKLWHATCNNVQILRANDEKHGISATESDSADDAVMALWRKVSTLPVGDALLVGYGINRKVVVWNGAIEEWVILPKRK